MVIVFKNRNNITIPTQCQGYHRDGCSPSLLMFRSSIITRLHNLYAHQFRYQTDVNKSVRFCGQLSISLQSRLCRYVVVFYHISQYIQFRKKYRLSLQQKQDEIQYKYLIAESIYLQNMFIYHVPARHLFNIYQS